ncbi:MAG: hypothetical protein FWF84_06790 [Kiritimatiellaeota bacterium]|nr:hypothetical protein [Kiritimatiellota bacterium]
MANCPKDGGFIGKSGCTHPNHVYSAETQRLLDSPPKTITAKEADAALGEGFYIQSKNGDRVGFGKPLKAHLDEKEEKDATKRKQHLLHAVDAVRTTAPEENHRLPGRKLYMKEIGDGSSVIAISDKSGNVDDVITIMRKRKGGRK